MAGNGTSDVDPERTRRAAWFRGLDEPTGGDLCVYLLGGGFGEAVIICLPGRQTIVVDGCTWNGRSLPSELLCWLGCTTVDCLVLTHPDEDHLLGLPALATNRQVERVWRFPSGGRDEQLVDLVHKLNPDDKRKKALRDALGVLSKLEFEERVSEPQIATTSWKVDAQTRVAVVAPPPFDIKRSYFGNEIDVSTTGDLVVKRSIRNWFGRETKALGAVNNQVSLALVIEWKSLRVLLAGDVTNGTKDKRSGWSGVIRRLDAENQLDLLRGLGAVKVAHHGSWESYWEAAWQLHSAGVGVPLAGVVPFSQGSLPDERTLAELTRHVETLALTAADDECIRRASASRWSRSGEAANAEAPAVSLRWSAPDARPDVRFGQRGAMFVSESG